MQAGGGSFMRHPSGGSFIIPPGYSESFPLGNGHYAGSGERVTVTPAGNTKAGAGQQPISVNVYGMVDVVQVARMVARELQRRQ
jgi:hypothetical protein